MNNRPNTPIGMIPRPIAEMTMQVMTPKRSVIIDMVMIQFISAIILGLGVLMFKGGDLTASETSTYMIGVFVAFLLLTSIYVRITQ
mgnify:FL=1